MDFVLQQTVATLDIIMRLEEEFTTHGVAFDPGPTSACSTVADAHTCYGVEYHARKGDLVLGYGAYLDFEEPAENPAGFVWVSLTAGPESRQVMALNFSSKTGWSAEADQERLRTLTTPEQRLVYMLFGTHLSDEQAFSSLRLMISVFLAHASELPC